ncbi:MAG: dihydrofolate reductase family protein [Trueperaceae bacterium]|nr:dihydrofolate reductase family protein [Trueperaceae bacterium]
MRKLKLQVQMSVDGFIAGPKGEMDWMARAWDDALVQYVTGLTESIGQIVLGKNLATGFIPHWAGVAADESHPEHAAGKIFTDTPKLVFSKTLEASSWDNTTLAKADLVTEINQLKAQEGKDIIAYGGGQFVSSLIKQGLIDEYHLFVNPVILGNGMPIFKELGEKQTLVLEAALPFSCGITVLKYKKAD